MPKGYIETPKDMASSGASTYDTKWVNLSRSPLEAPVETMRWGIAGYGDIVERRIAPALASPATKGTLNAIWGRQPDRARALADRYGVSFATDDFNRLCNLVDVVYIATPVVSHLSLAHAAMKYKKALLIEKPLSAGLGGTERFMDQLKLYHAPVGVAYYRRLFPAVQWLARALRTGAFGRFQLATVTFSAPFAPDARDPKAWRLERTVSGGGVLADAGAHRIDLLCALFGTPQTVSASFGDVTAGDCERSADIILCWSCGGTAVLHCRWAPDVIDRLDLTFTNGCITLDPLDSGMLVGRCGSTRIKENFAQPDNPHLALIQDFEAGIAETRAPACPAWTGLITDRILLAARDSSDRGVVMSVNDYISPASSFESVVLPGTERREGDG